MKSIFKILILTVMLRIWYNDPLYKKYTSGIFLGVNHGYFIIRINSGEIICLDFKSIIKSKWVEVKPDKD